MSRIVVGVFSNATEAERASTELAQAGIPRDHYRVLTPQSRGRSGFSGDESRAGLEDLAQSDARQVDEALQRGQSALVAQAESDEAWRVRTVLEHDHQGVRIYESETARAAALTSPMSPIATSAAFTKRVSWPALWAGLVLALSSQLVLGLLGIGVGASTVNPLVEQNPVNGLGIGAGIWLAVSMWIAVFVGGWVAARLAGVPDRAGGIIHGAATWGLTVLLAAYLLTTAVGGILGGSARMLGQTLGVVAQDVARNGDVNRAVNETRAAVNQAQTQFTGQQGQQNEQQARQTADTAAKGISRAGFWSFVGLIIGLGAAAWGGAIGVLHTSSGKPGCTKTHSVRGRSCT